MTEQLTAYFDATVERVTAEDVLAGSDVGSQAGRREPIRAPRLRPAWVVAAGFAVTVVLIGGAVGIARLLESDPAEVGTAPPPAGDVGEGLSGGWGLLIAAGVILVLAVVGLVWQDRNKNTKEQTMQTLERPEVEVSPRPRSPAILILLAALLVLAAGALGWWIGSSSDDSTAVEVPEIVNRVTQAYVDGDAEAVAANYSENAILEEMELQEPVSLRGETYTGRAVIEGHTLTGFGYADFEEMTVDEVMVLDNLIVYRWTVRGLSAASTEVSERLPFETTGVLVYEMEDGLIARSFLYYDREEFFNVNSP